MYHGQGRHVWEDGSYYKGEYERGLKHGEGHYFKHEKEIFYGLW